MLQALNQLYTSICIQSRNLLTHSNAEQPYKPPTTPSPASNLPQWPQTLGRRVSLPVRQLPYLCSQSFQITKLVTVTRKPNGQPSTLGRFNMALLLQTPNPMRLGKREQSRLKIDENTVILQYKTWVCCIAAWITRTWRCLDPWCFHIEWAGFYRHFGCIKNKQLTD